MPLERRCVRFLDNFSAGTRGAASVECAAPLDPDLRHGSQPERNSGTCWSRDTASSSLTECAPCSPSKCDLLRCAQSRPLTRLYAASLLAAQVSHCRLAESPGADQRRRLASALALYHCSFCCPLTHTTMWQQCGRSLHILRICTSCGGRCAQPATQARPFQLAKCFILS